MYNLGRISIYSIVMDIMFCTDATHYSDKYGFI